jgi:hypothetical protein
MSSPTQLVSGLGGAIGSDFRPTQNQLIFVEFNGKLSRLNLYRTATTVSSGTTTLKGTWSFDLETGTQGGVAPPFDIWWEQQTAVLRRMTPLNSAQIANLGSVDFNSITPDTLQSLSYSSVAIDGNNDPTNKLVTGDVFAVLTNKGNYAKVKVLVYGYDMQIQWVTYQLDTPYAVLGTGYQQPEDVKASVDGAHVYVTERTGDLLKVALATPNRAAANVVCAGLSAPQQMFLDEADQACYVVEYAPSGNLWRINLTNGVKTSLLSNLQNAVGLVVSADRQFAYISEQTTGPDLGRVSRFQLSNGARTPIVTGLTAPFFLTWLDTTQTLLLVPERDPANRVTLINVSSGTTQVIASGLPAKPSSVALIAPGDMLICCDQAIDELAFVTGLQPSGPLLIGIGFIPFDKITAAGLADTSVDPTYFYQVKNTPFGGTLPLMVNHVRAFNDGAVYYRVKVDAIVRTDPWTDEKWNGFEYVAQTVTPVTINNQPGYYPVRPPNEVFLWVNPSLGDLLDSTGLTNAIHHIVLEFTTANGTLLETSPSVTIRVDNNHCTATLAQPTVKGNVADTTCGILHYGTIGQDLVSMPFTATHPNGFATFSWGLIKAIASPFVPPVPPPPQPLSGPVSSGVSPITASVGDLMGTCTIAAFAESVYVTATANNGWGRQSQYDASALIAFALAP